MTDNDIPDLKKIGRNSVGEACTASGIYKSYCDHKYEITIKKGTKFPSCPKCHRKSRTRWSLEVELTDAACDQRDLPSAKELSQTE